jgi:hypothetical protein
MFTPVAHPLAVATLQRLNEASLRDVAEVLLPVVADLPGGGTRTTWTSVMSLPCRYAAVGNTGPERVLADQLGADAPVGVAVFAAGAVIDPRARLRISGITPDGGPWTKTVAVGGSTGPKSAEVLRKVVVVEVPDPESAEVAP